MEYRPSTSGAKGVQVANTAAGFQLSHLDQQIREEFNAIRLAWEDAAASRRKPRYFASPVESGTPATWRGCAAYFFVAASRSLQCPWQLSMPLSLARAAPHATEHREVTSYYKIHAFTPRPLPLRQICVTDGRHAS